MRCLRDMRRRAADESGFTLVELLVTMVAAVVIMLALGVIMDTTLTQTTKSFTLVDANERAQPVFEQIENELHSSCFADEETPIQAGSGPNALIFMTSYGNSASPTAMWEEIDYNPAAGTLTQSTYATSYSVVNGDPTWSRGALQSSKTLLGDVGPSGSTPVFQYFAYQTAPGTDAAGNQYEILPDGTAPVPGTSTTVTANPLAPGSALSATQAASAAEVMVSLIVGPAGGFNENTHLANVGQLVNDQIVLRFTPAPNHVGDGATFDPCD